MITAIMPAQGGEGRVVLSGIRWQTYEALLKDLQDRRLRLTYDQGNLEIMAPSFHHEHSKRQVGRVVETLAEEFNLPLIAGGSTTFRREDLERGLEPDDCFYINHAAVVQGRTEIDLRTDPPPDLALEVDITRSSLDRIGIYAALKVPEVWRFDGENLEVYRLRADGDYERVTTSPTFPGVPLDGVEAFLQQHLGTDDSSLVRAFRTWLRTQLPLKPPSAKQP